MIPFNFYEAFAQKVQSTQGSPKNESKLTLGKSIRELRVAQGLSGRELSRLSRGVDPRTLSAIEKGRIRNPSLLILQKIAGGLGCLVRDLFTGAEMDLAENYHLGSQKGAFQIEFPKQGLKVVSSTPVVSEFFCGKLILAARSKVSGALLKHTAPLFLEVIMGQVEIGVEEKRVILKEGENLLFNGRLEHFFRNPLSRESAVWLVTAPSFFR